MKGEEQERRADSDLTSDIIRRTMIIKIICMFLCFVFPLSCKLQDQLERLSLNRRSGVRHYLSPAYNAVLSSLPR